MRIRAEGILSLTGTNWFRASLSFLAVLLIGLAGGLVSWLTMYFVGKEISVLLALVVFCLVLFLSTVKFDFMVLMTFCLFSLVRIEPAPVDVLSMILLLVGLLTGNLSLRTLRGFSFIHLTLWLFVVMNLVSLMVTPAFSDSLRYVAITLYLIAFAYFVRMYVTSFHRMRNVIVGYLVSAVLATALVVLGYLGLGPPGMFVEENRAVALFKDANTFGPFLVPMIVLLVDEMWQPCVIPRFRALKALGVVTLTAAVFLSFSRGAWGNFGFSLLVYFLLNVKEMSPNKVIGLLLLSVVILLALVIVVDRLGLLEFLMWRTSPLQSYDAVRFARQAAGIEAGLTHLFGIGPYMLFHAHSLYVRTFAEYGVFGFVSLASCLLVTFIRTLYHALREIDKPYGLSAKVVFACFAGTLLSSLVIDTLHWRQLWLVFALSWVVISTAKNPAPSGEHRLGSRFRRTVQQG